MLSVHYNILQVRAYVDDNFEPSGELSDVTVNVLAMNPPPLGGERWRWGHVGQSVTHASRGACVPCVCDARDGNNWGYIRATRAGQPLRPAPANNSGLGQRVRDLLDYNVTVADGLIRTKLVSVGGAPFYFYAQRLLCHSDLHTASQPHFRFSLGTDERCQFEYTVLPVAQSYVQPVSFNHLAWYPRANPEHFYEVCYFKIRLGRSFVYKDADYTIYDEVKRAVVHGGGPVVVVLESKVGRRLGNVNLTEGDPFGSRSTCPIEQSACLEFRKSGPTYDAAGVIETAVVGHVEMSTCGWRPVQSIRTDFPEVAENGTMPLRMAGSRYGVYCEKGPVLRDVQEDALGHCYAGSDVRTSSSMVPLAGVGAVFCDDWCESNPCQNEGRCRLQESGFVCFCADGFYGVHCECTRGDEQKERVCAGSGG